MERAVSLGLVGVTVSPALQGFHPQHSRATALYEACEARGVPIFFETGANLAREAAMEHAQPVLLDEVARSHPKLKIVVSGLGDPFIDQTLALMAKHPTVFGELSSIATRPWRLYNALIEAHQLGVMSQLLFGSGFPAKRPDGAIVALYSASSTAQGTNMPGVPREQLRAVVERDAFACLGLTPPKPRRVIEAKGLVEEEADAPALPDPRRGEAVDPDAREADDRAARRAPRAALEEARR
jgi:predicted TIM-barrel fold metal-dependent hydrolase